MFCNNCGNQIPDDSKFCEFCGGVVASAPKKANAVKIVIPIVAAFVCIAAVVFVFLFNTSQAKANRELKKANMYLDEMEYEMAIASYKKVIALDPKNEEAYYGIASVYEAQGEYTEAIDVLIEGYQETDADVIKDRIVDDTMIVVNEYEQEGNYSDALDYLDTLIEQSRIAELAAMWDRVNREKLSAENEEYQESMDPYWEEVAETVAEEVEDYYEEQEYADFETQVVEAQDDMFGIYLKQLFSSNFDDDEPYATVAWINEVQGRKNSSIPTIFPLVPDEWIIWEDGTGRGLITQEQMLERWYFISGLELDPDDLGEPDAVRNGKNYYSVCLAMGWEGDWTELTNPQIIDTDGDLCTLMYHATVWGQGDFEYINLGEYDIMFFIKRDPHSVYNGLRIVGAEVE